MPGHLNTALVYGVSRLGRLKLHIEIYGQDDWTRRRCTKEDTHAKKVDYGHNKQAVLWNRNVCSRELTTIQNSLAPLLIVIWYLYFILGNVLTF